MRPFRRVVVPRAFALETLDVLQEHGHEGLEALVLWLVRVDGEEATVVRVWTPRQTSTRTKEGLHLHVGGDELARLNEHLYRSGETLLAQLHTHPSLGYHSPLDEAKPVVTEDGSFSIVVPSFGFVTLLDLAACAVYRIVDGEFVRVAPSEVARVFALRS